MPGPAPGQNITAGTIFGITKYDAGLYGIGIPPQYLVEPMSAASNSYTSVLVTWHPPSGIIFRYRLLRNRYGYPVNENDGDLIYDQTSYPGNSYTDVDVSQGTYHYYGFYVLVDIGDDIWIRSGFAGCLCIQNYGTGTWMFSLLPEYFTTIPQTLNPLVLTDYAQEDTALQSYLKIIGWMLDYLHTQYATYANHLNDATFIPLDDLWNLAAQVGLTFSPDVPAHTVRKATENFAHVAQQRGTLAGIEEEIALRTGYGADVHMGPNIMLDDDHAQILNPIFVQFDIAHKYMRDDCVWVPHQGNDRHSGWNGDGWWYRCNRDNTTGHTPPAAGFGVSDQYWTAVYDYDDFLGTQVNIETSNPGAWEMLDTGDPSFLPVRNSCIQGLGVLAPQPIRESGGSSHAWNCLRLYNRQASPRTIRCRSISRRHVDLGQIPDSSFEAGTTIPEEFRRHNRRWVRDSWPRNTCHNWMREDADDISVTAYWTTINADIDRENLIAHTGYWAMQVTPTGSANVIASFPAPQYNNPSFGSDDIRGWSGNNCNIRRSVSHSHSGNFSLLVEPLFTVIGNASFTITPTQTTGTIGSQFLHSDLPFITGPLVSVTLGATEAVSLYCYGTENPNTAEAIFPTVVALIVFYDINGNVLQINTGTPVTLSAAWSNITATGITPAGAFTKTVIIQAQDTTPGYPTVNNFHVDDITWSLVVVQQTLQLNSPWVECPPATNCTGSAYYNATATGSTIFAQLGYYDVRGNLIGTSTGAVITGTVSTWVNPATSGTSPAGTAYAELQLIVLSPPSIAYVDDTTITPTVIHPPQPDQIQAVRDGIPVPWVLNSQEWLPAIRYITNDIVHYDNQPFIALRASTGSIPPANDVASTDWAPLSQSQRIRLCLSSYVSQTLSLGVNFSYATRAFIEWYDQQGNFIATVYARSAAGNGSVSQPNQMAYDSFTTQSIIASAGSAAYTMLLTNWDVTFWNNIILIGEPSCRRHDPDVHFDWDGDSPGFGVASSGWSASWVTSFTAPVPGTYGFQLQAGNGGSRLIINGITLIDNWANQSGTNLTAAVTFAAGQVVTVEVNYFNPPLQAISFSDDLIIAPGIIIIENLFDEVEPGYWGHREVTSFTSQPFRCRARDRAQLNHFTFSGTADLFITANWFDIHGNCIGTGQERFSAGDYDDLSSHFEAPDGCWTGSISFAPDEHHGFFRQHDHPDFHCHIGGRGDHDGPTCIAPIIIAAVNQNFIVHGLVQVPAVPALTATYSNALAGRVTDDEQSNWVNPIGPTWTVGGFAGGSVWPSNPTQQTIGILTTQPANTSLGVTLRSMPAPGWFAGLIFRYTNTQNYWRCDQQQLGFIQNGAYTLIAVHTTMFQANDRMTVVLNGTSVIVYRNGIQVNSAVSAFNQTATKHGIINDGVPYQLEEILQLDIGGKPHRAALNQARQPSRGSTRKSQTARVAPTAPLYIGKPHRGSPARPGGPRQGIAQGSWVPSVTVPVTLYAGKYFRSS